MRIKGSLVTAFFFLLLGLYGLIQSLTFGYWESMALPAGVSGVIAVMAAVEVSKELYGQRKQRAAGGVRSVPLKHIDRQGARRLVLIICWTAALMLGVYLFGFHISVPLFAFLYLKWKRKRWLTAIILALVMLGIVYGAFEYGLKAQLFQGIVFGDR